MSLVLRPYQTEAIANLRASYAAGRRAALLALPTGGGKTVIFSEVARASVAQGNRVLIIENRRELIGQASEKLALAGVEHGFIAAGMPSSPEVPVQVASIQTVVNRLDEIPEFNLIIVDEAHHAVAGQYVRLFEAQPQAFLLGVTATPARLDGKGLGIDHGGFFDDLVVGPTVAELVRREYLSPCRVFTPTKRLSLAGVATVGGDYATGALAEIMARGSITGDAIKERQRHADNQAAIAFCVTIGHAEAVAQSFRDAGYRAECVHGGTPKDERDAAIAGLATGKTEILTACDLISEGLDVPAVGCVILLRPTQSLVLHLQQVGRGMRPAPGKSHLIILDHAGNTLAHGLPDADRIWTLAGADKQAGEAPVWRCPECDCMNSLGSLVCEDCGATRPGGAPSRETFQVAGDLTEITAARFDAVRRMSYRQIVNARLSEAELREYARANGYKAGWVFHRLREQRQVAA